ncbi:E3 ubiquitin-protein ligase TRIM7-like [Elgaria multicarinata webbii]|uniref:E3 ubiquitin-protein ligase TRIM7-like n=1 Tax=Elgaria multicarinata webbii TaxID=159646 RepID=UPI002FCD04D8
MGDAYKDCSLETCSSHAGAMDAEKAVECIRDEATCSICLELFKEPMILDCGHNFCNACITQCWQGTKSNVCCPECRQSFANAKIRPNRQLRNILGLIKQFRLKDVEMVKTTTSLCKLHQKPVRLFCTKDQALLCLVCVQSNAHIGHPVAPIEDAAQDSKDEIHTLLEVKQQQYEAVLKCFSAVKEQRHSLVKLMEDGAQKMAVEYKQLGQQMKELQADVKALAALMETDFDDEMIELCKRSSYILKQIDEIQRVCKLPACEFIQDIKQTMRKCQAETFQAPERVSPKLKEKLWDLSVRSLFVQDTLRKCTETLPLKPKVERANVTLDPATACAQLILSEDRKSVKQGPLILHPAASSRGFDSVPFVLGSRGFTWGRHYWEVEIAAEGGNWAVGVAKESVKRKGVTKIDPTEGIWALQAESAHLHDTRKIRVYVDYGGRRVAFFDANSSDLIATLVPAAFAGECVFPFFMLLKEGAQAKLHP